MQHAKHGAPDSGADIAGPAEAPLLVAGVSSLVAPSATTSLHAAGAVEAITRTGTSDTLDACSRRSLAIWH